MDELVPGAMSLPFTTQQFLGVFARYNEAVWPAPLALHLIALACVGALSLRSLAAPLICAGLAFLWLWTGVLYHGLFFSAVNPAAPVFAALFVAGAAIFAWQGVLRDRLRFALTLTPRGMVGVALLAYGLFGYPALAIALGHSYPAMPSFGTPCPLTIFTIGMLALLRPPYPRHVFIAPLAWVVVGSQATLLFGMYEDLGLLAAGAVGAWLALHPFPHTRPA